MSRRGFSLIELVLVVVIIGIIGAIAIPRMSSAADNSRTGALRSTLSTLQNAIDLYVVEHSERSPALTPGGAVGTSTEMIARLTGTTDSVGTVGGTGYGPYLRAWPKNPRNNLSTLRIGGAAAGAGTHGWRFDPTSLVIEGDHKSALAISGDVQNGGNLQPGGESP